MPAVVDVTLPEDVMLTDGDEAAVSADDAEEIDEAAVFEAVTVRAPAVPRPTLAELREVALDRADDT